MSAPEFRLPDDGDARRRARWEKGCYALLVGIALVLFAAWLHDIFEVMSGLMMGIFFLYQVVRGLIIKRYYWHIAEEKVSFWALAAGLVLAITFYLLCHAKW